MKYAIILVFASAALISCNAYSPMDQYIDAVIKSDSLNEQSRIEAQNYIDSVNRAHIIIHLNH